MGFVVFPSLLEILARVGNGSAGKCDLRGC